jgi:catechol 2,3-dioxygenase-like lactoylglutathione lyase family enzyme
LIGYYFVNSRNEEKNRKLNMTVLKTHISLNVSDVAASVAFYEAFLGVKAHKRRPGYANFDLESPALKLALNESAHGPGGALNHLGIVVGSTQEVDAARARLAAAGLVALDEGDTVCCHARQDKVWAQDPDGNAWEIYTILDDMQDGAFEAPPTAGECCTKTEATCCGIALPMVSTSKGCGCS